MDVYIYESHSEDSFDGRATWRARYVHLEPERAKAKSYRPKSTESDTFEGEVYWIVEGLRRMPVLQVEVQKIIGHRGQSAVR